MTCSSGRYPYRPYTVRHSITQSIMLHVVFTIPFRAATTSNPSMILKIPGMSTLLTDHWFCLGDRTSRPRCCRNLVCLILPGILTPVLGALSGYHHEVPWNYRTYRVLSRSYRATVLCVQKKAELQYSVYRKKQSYVTVSQLYHNADNVLRNFCSVWRRSLELHICPRPL